MKTRKRILSVKIKRMMDDSPDTSHMGEYGNRAMSQFSIDRAHMEDCSSIEANYRECVDKLERIIGHLNEWRLKLGYFLMDPRDNPEYDAIDKSMDVCIALQEEAMACDCSGGDIERHEYRYFNPSFNYVVQTSSGRYDKPADGLTPEDVRKYVRQDYERMERLNAGDWCYIGIRAEAEIVAVYGSKSTLSEHVTTGGSGPIQHITSGGLWGIESDSDKSYFAEVQTDELADLKTQLLALGFSRRAISQAFKNVEEVSA